MAYTPRVKGSTKTSGQLRTQGSVSVGPNAKGPIGIYDHHPSPGLADYKADVGPNDISVKFAETGIGDANTQVNQLRQSKGVNKTGKAPLVKTSNMNKKKNRYSQVGPTKQSR